MKIISTVDEKVALFNFPPSLLPFLPRKYFLPSSPFSLLLFLSVPPRCLQGTFRERRRKRRRKWNEAAFDKTGITLGNGFFKMVMPPSNFSTQRKTDKSYWRCIIMLSVLVYLFSVLTPNRSNNSLWQGRLKPPSSNHRKYTDIANARKKKKIKTM